MANIIGIARDLFDSYESYKLNEIISHRFTQAEMLRWISSCSTEDLFRKTIAGISGEGREIPLFSFGSGPLKVLMWSQMHGDEPTATMALMDFFQFITTNRSHPITQSLRKNMTLQVIPMLNPDGAERFTRRTAQWIDINRDALALATPEARILKHVHDTVNPEYAFNLHDQDPRYTAGSSKKITTVALLAPAADEMRTDTPVRLKAKGAASLLAQIFMLFIPGRLAKWDDTFSPTAFGDNIQRWGTSTVLIESGGWRGDPKKFFIRKLNCVGLLSALYALAEGAEAKETSAYEEIPFNMKLGCDYIIRNAVLPGTGQASPVAVDLGINFDTRLNNRTGRLETYGTIVEMGDLRLFTALEDEIDAEGSELHTEHIRFEYSFLAEDINFFLKG